MDFHGKKHSLYNNLINYPPENYKFITNATSLNKFINRAVNIELVPKLFNQSVNKIIPISILRPYLEKNFALRRDIDLIYSSGHIIFRDIPWVVDLEFVTHLSGYNPRCFHFYKHLVRKYLESKNCRKIIPWTLAGKKTILMNFNSEAINDKVETVYLSVPPKKFTKIYDNDSIKLLFVGSQNFPRDFEIKGGKEVLEAFNKLNTRYNNIELIMRSYVPGKLKSKYAKLKKLRIIDDLISWDILEHEFKSADIFLFPSYNTPGLAILDAMSYELPVITADVWANSEMVENYKTGLLIEKSKRIRYYDEKFVPTWSSKEAIRSIKQEIDRDVVNDLVKKTSILIEDELLRKNMGRAGRFEVEYGKFSIERRNNILKRIFDEAIQK
jgi:glycosyltransferase involved in cell wall biosynthesis